MKTNGIPESNIILMMQDDVANAAENPFPGQLFNKPTVAGTPGVDVYAGCAADYTGSIVTAALWQAVITGDSAAIANMTAGYTAGKTSTKVLKSTETSKVFLNFVDHGGVGIIAFPNGPFLHAKSLQASLATMKTKAMYNQLVFYVEACESGSMFASFPTDNSVYVTTAANAKESSWGTYCPPDDKVNGKELKSCLGDLYSVNWMEDSQKQVDAQQRGAQPRRLGAPRGDPCCSAGVAPQSECAGLDKNDCIFHLPQCAWGACSYDAASAAETLEAQYQTVKTLTNKSHVMEFGDQSFSSASIAEFQGVADAAPSSGGVGSADSTADAAAEMDLKLRSAVAVPDIPLHTAYYAYLRASAGTAEARVAAQRLSAVVDERESSARTMRAVAQRLVGAARADALLRGAANPGAVLRDGACHRAALESYATSCRAWSDHSQTVYSRAVVAMCEATALDAAPIVAAFSAECHA